MIEQIILRNYKSIKDQTLQLNRINLLIGGNGAGKSNLISFFDLLNSIFQQRLGEYTLKNGGVNRIFHNGIKHSKELTAITNFSNTNALFLRIQPSPESNKAYLAESGDFFNSRQTADKDYSKWDYTQWDRMTEESQIMTNKSWESDYLRTDLNGVRVYHFHDTSNTAPMRSLCPTHDNDTLRPDGANLAACLYRMQQTESDNFKLLEGIVRSVAPYFKRFKLSPNNLVENNIQIQWEAKGTDAYFDSYSFSDGTIRFIALATLLLQKKKPETIIIDEPELGLHPTAIIKFAALVKRASLERQIILATQSTGVVNQFDAEDIIVADRKDGQSTFSRLNPNELEEWMKEYSIGDIWEKNIIGGHPK